MLEHANVLGSGIGGDDILQEEAIRSPIDFKNGLQYR